MTAGVLILATDTFGRALSGIAGALQLPVHIAAVALLAVLALELGRLATEWWRRVRPGSPGLQEIATRALADPSLAAVHARVAPGALAERTVLELARAAPEGPEAIEHALADYELQTLKRLDRTRLLVRAGPALGLMGTLIPLAPGLSALGDGDFQKLAGDLRIAFAATVIGILVGTLAFALTTFRARVYVEDLSALERAVAAHGKAVAT